MKKLALTINLTTMFVIGLSFTINAMSLPEIYEKLVPLTKSVQMSRISNNQMTCLVVRPPIILNDTISMEYYFCSNGGFTDYSGNKWFFSGRPVMFNNERKLVISDRTWFGWIDLVYSEKNRKEVESLIALMREKDGGDEIGFAQYLLDNDHLPRKKIAII